MDVAIFLFIILFASRFGYLCFVVSLIHKLMKFSFKALLSIALFSMYCPGMYAQQNGKYPAQPLTHQMGAEEALRAGEIGRNFVETEPPTGIITSLGEFERAKGALLRYPFGIPLNLIRELAKDDQVTTLVANASQEATVRTQYTSAGVNLDHCDFIYAASDSYWTRDYGPWFITYGDHQVGIVDFPYNRPRPNDDEVPKVVAAAMGIPWFGMNVKHTGGNYMSDSYGNAASTTIAYTENPTQTPAAIDQKMQDYLGIADYHVLEDPNNTYIDHIDCWGKYLATNKVLIRSVPPSHPQYNEIEATAAYFASLTTPWGVPFQIYRVNTPDNQPYTNSYIFNKKVFVPITGSPNDEDALNVYRQAMPGYQIFGITEQPSTPWESTDALHCRVHELADPQMLRIKHFPLLGSIPEAGQYALSANIIAYSGAGLYTDSLTVYYRINPNAYTPWSALQMTHFAGDNYSASLPAQDYGSTVEYYLHAADSSGHSEFHPFIGSPDPHRFFVGEPYTATAQVEPQQLSLTAMQGLTDSQAIQITNAGQTWLNGHLTVSTLAYDTITHTVPDSPAANAYNYNTLTENGWTSFTVNETGTLSAVVVSYTWNTDNYASEGSIWLQSPDLTTVMLASGQANGVYSVSTGTFNNQPMEGEWKLWIQDSYGDGGHQATGVSIRFIRGTSTGNWLSCDMSDVAVDPGMAAQVQVGCDASGLNLGTYHGLVTLWSNDSTNPLIYIPVTFEVTVNTAVDLSSRLPSEIEVFPNPVYDKLYVKLNLQGSSALIQLSDVAGRIMVESMRNVSKDEVVELPVKHLNPGLYILRVQMPGFNQSVQVVKLR